MTDSRSSQRKPGGGDSCHADQHRHGPRKTQPQKLRDSHELACRSEFVQLRMQFGTQAQAAVALGVSRASVENWERGSVRIPAWALRAIREAAKETGT